MESTSSFTAFAEKLRHFMASPAPDAHAFDALALELFALQFNSNPPYRKVCEALGITPQNIKSPCSIPTVPASGFKELPITCLPENERLFTFCSSGTTSERQSMHAHNHASMSLYEASLWPWFKHHLLPKTLPRPELLLLTPSAAAAPHSSLVHMLDTIRKHLKAPDEAFVGVARDDGAWTLQFEPALARLRAAVNAHSPVLLIGTAFSFVHLLDELARAGIRIILPEGSRVMETGGYKGRSRSLPKANLHHRIQEALGIPNRSIVSEYGMCELSSQAYDAVAGATDKRVFRFPPWAQGRVISPETGCEVAEGETGLIRIMDLANAYSVMHIQTEDLGRKRDGGFELLGRAAQTEPRGCSLMPE